MITSLSNPRMKDYAKLTKKKYRDATNMFIVEGEHLVIEAARAGVIREVIALSSHPDFKQATLVNEAVMKKITDTKTAPRIIAVCNFALSDTLHKRVLLLEKVQDPGNMGTLLRSALAFNFRSIILDDCVDILNPKVLRSTQGAIFHLAVRYTDAQTFKKTHPEYTMIATAITQKGSPSYPSEPFVLMLGNEGQGLEPSTEALADTTVHIPTETVESLNVGVAGSILMQALTQKRIFTTK